MVSPPSTQHSSDAKPNSTAMDPVSAADLKGFGRRIGWLLLILCVPFLDWARYPWNHDIQSYILLIPAISAYLAWINKDQILWGRRTDSGNWKGWGVAAVCFLAGYVISKWAGMPLKSTDANTFSAAAIVCGVLAVARSWFLDATLKQLRFPLLFLFFAVPLPDFALTAAEVGLQHASAEVTAWFFNLTGLGHLRSGLIFQLPGIQIMVAQECSGIRSTLVLLVTSAAAGYLFLRHPGNRLLFVLSTIAIGIVRNAFRITVISWLCVEIGPHMIHSIVHKRGGPIFFALALIPTVLFLFLLRRWESKSKKPTPPASNAAKPGTQPPGSRSVATS